MTKYRRGIASFIDSLRDQFFRHKWLTKNQIRELVKICKRHGIM